MKRVLYWSKPSAYQIPVSNLYFNGQIFNGQFNFLENSMIDFSEMSYGCSHLDFPNQGVVVPMFDNPGYYSPFMGPGSHCLKFNHCVR